MYTAKLLHKQLTHLLLLLQGTYYSQPQSPSTFYCAGNGLNAGYPGLPTVALNGPDMTPASCGQCIVLQGTGTFLLCINLLCMHLPSTCLQLPSWAVVVCHLCKCSVTAAHSKSMMQMLFAYVACCLHGLSGLSCTPELCLLD